MLYSTIIPRVAERFEYGHQGFQQGSHDSMQGNKVVLGSRNFARQSSCILSGSHPNHGQPFKYEDARYDPFIFLRVILDKCRMPRGSEVIGGSIGSV